MVLKFEGEYHGWHDELAVSIRPTLAEAGPPESPNPVHSSGDFALPSGHAVVAPLNDCAALESVFRLKGPELACAIIEPIAHTTGCISIDAEFLHLLRRLCDEHGVILFFDEILTGFRHSIRGAQSLVGVTPDLAAFGKAMANGFPIAALVGRRAIMEGLTPTGPALYSGTFNSHLLSVVAAQATIAGMERRQIHQHTSMLGERVSEQINRSAAELRVPVVCQAFGSIFCTYFGRTGPVRQYRDLAEVQVPERAAEVNRRYRFALRDAGIYLQPYFVNRSFISAAHTVEDVDRVIAATIDFMEAASADIQELADAVGTASSR
jgi:glutamate-1-semialdehyde 2,1-aminomutase